MSGKMRCDVVFDFLSKHNGEYWYKCNTCGATDWCAYSDKFENDKPLKGCKMERTMKSPKKQKSYVWVRKDWTISIIEDPTELLDTKKFSDYDPENDRIYELGPEVEIKVNVSVKNKEPVYRSSGSVE